MIITIDGPSGTGKSTVAKLVAQELGFFYFDSGAVYRSFAYFFDNCHGNLEDEESIKKLAGDFPFKIDLQAKIPHYYIGNEEITSKIRTPHIALLASSLSSSSIVRESLLPIQQSFAKQTDVVFEGRDMGTVVFPSAQCKFFLTARPEIRIDRRYNELKTKGIAYKDVVSEIMERDHKDINRMHAPLKQAEDAILIDTSNLTIEQVVALIIKRIKEKSVRKRSHIFYKFILTLARCFFRLFYNYKVYGLEHRYEGGAIIAANHTSFYDPPIVSVSWEEEVNFLARESLFKNPLFGKLIRALNAHPLSGDAGDIKVFKTICNLLNQGKKVILFPEGTRSLDGELGLIKPGIGLLLTKTRTAIIPAYIHGANEIWNRYKKFPKFGGSLTCVFGSPITWESVKDIDRKVVNEVIAQKLVDSIHNLKKWLLDGAIGIPP